MSAGESIELTPLLNKVVAIRVIERVDQKTKFGDRQMSTAQLLVEGETEPLQGVLFQSYFQRLAIGQWFVGKVIKTERSWGLETEGIKPAAIAKLEKAIDAFNDNEPF